MLTPRNIYSKTTHNNCYDLTHKQPTLQQNHIVVFTNKIFRKYYDTSYTLTIPYSVENFNIYIPAHEFIHQITKKINKRRKHYPLTPITTILQYAKVTTSILVIQSKR